MRVPGLENPVPRAQMPMGPRDSGAASSPDAGGAPISGRVLAGEGVASGGDGVLFVIARSAGGGPPLAVKRLPIGPFPLAFEIGPADVMMTGRSFSGPITLSARIDRDGNPLTRDAGDAAAALPASVEPGARDIELTLLAPAPG